MSKTILSPTAEGTVTVTGWPLTCLMYGKPHKFFVQDGAYLVLDYASGRVVVSFEKEKLGWMIDNLGRKLGVQMRRRLALLALERVQLQCPAERFWAEVSKHETLNKEG